MTCLRGTLVLPCTLLPCLKPKIWKVTRHLLLLFLSLFLLYYCGSPPSTLKKSCHVGSMTHLPSDGGSISSNFFQHSVWIPEWFSHQPQDFIIQSCRKVNKYYQVTSMINQEISNIWFLLLWLVTMAFWAIPCGLVRVRTATVYGDFQFSAASVLKTHTHKTLSWIRLDGPKGISKTLRSWNAFLKV